MGCCGSRHDKTRTKDGRCTICFTKTDCNCHDDKNKKKKKKKKNAPLRPQISTPVAVLEATNTEQELIELPSKEQIEQKHHPELVMSPNSVRTSLPVQTNNDSHEKTEIKERSVDDDKPSPPKENAVQRYKAEFRRGSVAKPEMYAGLVIPKKPLRKKERSNADGARKPRQRKSNDKAMATVVENPLEKLQAPPDPDVDTGAESTTDTKNVTDPSLTGLEREVSEEAEQYIINNRKEAQEETLGQEEVIDQRATQYIPNEQDSANQRMTQFDSNEQQDNRATQYAPNEQEGNQRITQYDANEEQDQQIEKIQDTQNIPANDLASARTTVLMPSDVHFATGREIVRESDTDATQLAAGSRETVLLDPPAKTETEAIAYGDSDTDTTQLAAGSRETVLLDPPAKTEAENTRESEYTNTSNNPFEENKTDASEDMEQIMFLLEDGEQLGEQSETKQNNGGEAEEEALGDLMFLLDEDTEA
eukprot:m.9083 g.9083  ORF g.9083 m.9083 type:complete len:477 (+) comp4006_c0_seq1:642-2072(+)